MATRESGSVRGTPGARFVVTGVHTSEAAPGGGDPEAEEQGYVCLDVDTLELPYLPDPWGYGARLRLQFDPADPEPVIEAAYPRGAAGTCRDPCG